MLRAAYGARVALEATAEHRGFTPRTDDRIAGELLLPPGAAPAFQDRFTLWRAVDARGDHARAPRDLGGVTGLELLLALPRLHELSVEEMSDLVRAFCARFLAEKLAVQWDIHAPGPLNGTTDGAERAIAVHAHILVSGRPIRGDRVLPGRTRLFDPVMRPGYRRSIGWSREWRVAQERFFAERAIPLAVAAPSGVREPPLGRSRFQAEMRERVAAKRAQRRADLREPEAVIDALLRSRWAFDRADLDALLGSVFPPGAPPQSSGEPPRSAIAETVLRHPSLRRVRTIDHVPSWATLRWAERAARAIAHAEAARPIAAPDPDERADWDPDDPAAPWPDQPAPSRWPGILPGETLPGAVLRLADGRRSASCAVMVAVPTTLAYGRMAPVRQAGHRVCAVQALAQPEPDARGDAALIIVPYAEMLTDPELEAVLDFALASEATLLLLRDPAQPDRLRPSLLGELHGRGLLEPAGAAPSLRRHPASVPWREARLDDEDIAAMAADAQASGLKILATGPALVARLSKEIRRVRIAAGAIDATRRIRINGLELSPGDQFVVHSAWDRQTPPRRAPGLRAGEVLTVVSVDADAATIVARSADGTTLTIQDQVGAGTLAYAGAFPVRLAIAAGITEATLILDEPRTAFRTLELRGGGQVDPVRIAPAAASLWRRAAAAVPEAVAEVSDWRTENRVDDAAWPEPVDEGDDEFEVGPVAATDERDEPGDFDDGDAILIVDEDGEYDGAEDVAEDMVGRDDADEIP